MKLDHIFISLLNSEGVKAAMLLIAMHGLNFVLGVIDQVAKMNLIKVLTEIFISHEENSIISIFVSLKYSGLCFIFHNVRPKLFIVFRSFSFPFVLTPRVTNFQYFSRSFIWVNHSYCIQLKIVIELPMCTHVLPPSPDLPSRHLDRLWCLRKLDYFL